MGRLARLAGEFEPTKASVQRSKCCSMIFLRSSGKWRRMTWLSSRKGTLLICPPGDQVAEDLNESIEFLLDLGGVDRATSQSALHPNRRTF